MVFYPHGVCLQAVHGQDRALLPYCQAAKSRTLVGKNSTYLGENLYSITSMLIMLYFAFPRYFVFLRGMERVYVL